MILKCSLKFLRQASSAADPVPTVSIKNEPALMLASSFDNGTGSMIATEMNESDTSSKVVAEQCPLSALPQWNVYNLGELIISLYDLTLLRAFVENSYSNYLRPILNKNQQLYFSHWSFNIFIFIWDRVFNCSWP